MKKLRLLSCVIVASVGLMLAGCQSGPFKTAAFASNLNAANNNSKGKNFRPSKTEASHEKSDASLYAEQLPTKREIDAYRKQYPAHLAGYQTSGAYGRNSGSHANCKT